MAAGAVAVSTFLLGFFGEAVLGSTLPYLDAMTVALAVIAQLLMVWRYREQWACWILIDVVSLIMFIILGQWSMVAMYIAWTANAFYGWCNWSKLENLASTLPWPHITNKHNFQIILPTGNHSLPPAPPPSSTSTPIILWSHQNLCSIHHPFSSLCHTPLPCELKFLVLFL